MNKNAFWRYKTLSEMTAEEWEALCDGCGRCCLYKLEDQDTGEVSYTSVACRLLDIESCRCTAYQNRQTEKDDCLTLTSQNVESLFWLPETCAYRLLAEGGDLPSWHPLVSGNSESVHAAGVSLRNNAISEGFIDPEDFEAYLTDLE